MAKWKNGAPKSATTQDEIVRRVVVSSEGEPVTITALTLSKALAAQLVVKGPIPSAK